VARGADGGRDRAVLQLLTGRRSIAMRDVQPVGARLPPTYADFSDP
jgi:hypothetical protein